MRKARQVLMQIGAIVLVANGILWFVSNIRDEGALTIRQLLFPIGVFLLGLLLVGAGGVLVLIEKLQGPGETTVTTEPRVIEESDLIVDDSGESEETNG